MPASFQQFLSLASDFRYLIAIGTYLLWLIFIGFFIKRFDKIAEKIVSKTSTQIDDIILRKIKLPLRIILMVGGFFVVSRTVGLPPTIVPYINRISQLAILFAAIYFVAQIVLNLLQVSGHKNQAVRNMVPTFDRIVNVVVWLAGILIVVDLFGISITPVIASLGLAGLALGLALQDTLSNFFAGIYILISQPVRVGDYIALENGLKGYVSSIGWRETRIRTLPNNTVVIPNSKLSQSIITNFYLPQQEMACLVQVGVSYESDLEKVEKVTIETGKQVLEKISGGIKTFTPFIRYHTFADFSINFTVILRVAEFVDKYLVTHEFIKALHVRFNKEGITIPFPIRTIYNETKDS